MRSVVFVIILLSATRLSPSTLREGIVVWNVGQGQWITMAERDTCLHFDMGGEFFPWQQVKALCAHRRNEVFLSHWDWDHIGALSQSKLRKTLPDLCLRIRPTGKAAQKKRQRLLASFPSCRPDPKDIFFWRPSQTKTSNESSQIFFYKNVLMPGDSTKKQESIWSCQSWVPQTRVLILGHHGSKTSTSQDLVKRLSLLQMSISSARWKRYFHPHPEVLARMKSARVPVLRTEDWGNIWL